MKLKPDAPAIILGLATKEVEAIVLTFLTRAREKLGPVVERKSGIKMEKAGSRGGFERGAWTGHIVFTFDDGTGFVATMKVITNFTKHGRSYGQYPMTFHEVRFGEDEPKSMASIEEIWASVGYVPPTPVRKPRWSKIVPGCVVMHEGKRVFIPTPGVAKKLGITDEAEQIARIEAGGTSCFVEHADGRTEKYKYTAEDVIPFQALDREGSYNKASAARRDFAFRHFFP